MVLVDVIDWLETFGCDMQNEGIYPFFFVYNSCLANKTRGVKGKIAFRCLEDYAQVKGVYSLSLNSKMRAALRPILTAEDSALEYFGLHLEKRTPCALAEALADLALEERGRNRG